MNFNEFLVTFRSQGLRRPSEGCGHLGRRGPRRAAIPMRNGAGSARLAHPSLRSASCLRRRHNDGPFPELLLEARYSFGPMPRVFIFL